jgi:hypothetical protein
MRILSQFWIVPLALLFVLSAGMLSADAYPPEVPADFPLHGSHREQVDWIAENPVRALKQFDSLTFAKYAYLYVYHNRTDHAFDKAVDAYLRHPHGEYTGDIDFNMRAVVRKLAETPMHIQHSHYAGLRRLAADSRFGGLERGNHQYLMKAFKLVGADREAADQARAFLAHLDLPAPRVMNGTQPTVWNNLYELTEALRVVREGTAKKKLSQYAKGKVAELQQLVEQEIPRWQKLRQVRPQDRHRPGEKGYAIEQHAAKNRQLDRFTREVLAWQHEVPTVALTPKGKRYVGAHFRGGTYVRGYWRPARSAVPKARPSVGR